MMVGLIFAWMLTVGGSLRRCPGMWVVGSAGNLRLVFAPRFRPPRRVRRWIGAKLIIHHARLTFRKAVIQSFREKSCLDVGRHSRIVDDSTVSLA